MIWSTVSSLLISGTEGADGWTVTYHNTTSCALKGSTVEITCTFHHQLGINDRGVTAKHTFWFRKQQDNQRVDLRTNRTYIGRVRYHCDSDRCSLSINDLRESDAAVYVFGLITSQGSEVAGEPGVTLTVTGTVVVGPLIYDTELNDTEVPEIVLSYF